MNKTGSLCPAAKSAEIIGDKWILLILRELFLGTTRFNDFQRALPRMSPSILSKRLRKLEADGLVIRKKSSGDKTKEYRLTRAGRELAPIVDHMATWGMRWARRRIAETDIDIGSFMWDFHRTANIAELPDGETVLSVTFKDVDELGKWWVVINQESSTCAQTTRAKTLIFISLLSLPNWSKFGWAMWTFKKPWPVKTS